MLVLVKPKMIYIHLQKCGGTSVELSFDVVLRWNDLLIGSSTAGERLQFDYEKRFHLTKHSSARQVCDVVGSKFWGRHYSWATVRSPYSLVSSLFGFAAAMIEPLLAKSSFPLTGSHADQLLWMTTDAFPTTIPWRFGIVVAYLQARGTARPFSTFLRSPLLHRDPGFQPQWQRLTDKSGKLLVSRIVKLEELGAAWPELVDQFGFPGLKLLHVNKTAAQFRRPSATLFDDPSDVALVERLFDEDFANLGYHGMSVQAAA